MQKILLDQRRGEKQYKTGEGCVWSEDTQMQWQTSFEPDWNKATEEPLGKTVVGPGQCVSGHWRILLGLTDSSLLGKGKELLM